MLVVHNDIVRAIDDGHVASLALLDLSSAFDSVDHSTLLSVLRSRFSVTEQSGSFHTIQVFTTNSGHTHPIPLTSGVPRLESWSGTIYLIQRMYNQFLFLTLPSIPHVCRRHTILHSLCNIRDSRISALSSCIERPRQILCFLTASTQTGENRVHFVRFTRQLDQNTTALSINSSLRVCNRL